MARICMIVTLDLAQLDPNPGNRFVDITRDSSLIRPFIGINLIGTNNTCPHDSLLVSICHPLERCMQTGCNLQNKSRLPVEKSKVIYSGKALQKGVPRPLIVGSHAAT